jgi:ferrous iron transport protein B
MRMRSYLIDAVPFVMLGVIAVSLLQYLHVFQAVTDITAPVFTRILGLPKEAVLAVLVGIFRKDVAVGMLSALHLAPGQLIVAVTVLAMSFPCVATFVVLARELGWAGLVRSTLLMLATALIAGGALNLIL